MTEISPRDLKSVHCGANYIRPSGFLALNLRNCTSNWLAMEYIGVSSDEDEEVQVYNETGRIFYEIRSKYERYTGKVLLKIRGDGIRDRVFICDTNMQDRSIPKHYRKKFKHEVYKSIKTRFPACGEYFNLMLHYNCGVMDKLEIDDTTEK